MVLLAAVAILKPPGYEAISLGFTPTEMNRIAMNDRGTIVGTNLNAAGKYEGFVYQKGHLTPVNRETPWAGGLNSRDEAVFSGSINC